MNNIDRILALTDSLAANELETLAMRIADQANAKREPYHGNRGFTFVHTHLDCTFPHPLFYKEKLPTNEELRRDGIAIKVLPPIGDEPHDAILDSVVHDNFGMPCANIRFGTDRELRWASWDCEKYGWRLAPN